MDPALLMAIADKESNFITRAKARTSSASGLFQFVEKTWMDAMKLFGHRYGRAEEAQAIASGGGATQNRAKILGLRNDPYLSAALAAEMLKKDGAKIAEKIGRPLTAGETYLIHFLGPDDAARFMKTMSEAPNVSAAALLPRPARANRPIFFAQQGRKLGRLLSRLIRDPVEVEDVAQEAFIKAYRALPSFRGDSAFYTWLYRIGINTAKNYLVTMGRRAPTVTDVDNEEAEDIEDGTQLKDMNTPESQMMTRQIAETVNSTLQNLPEELRTAITLRELDGLSYEEIAQIMNCPIGTVRSRIFRAREAIAEKLRPQLDVPKDRRW